MTKPIAIESTIHFHRRGRGSRKEIRQGAAPEPLQQLGRVPRISKLMSLAIRFDGLIREGKVRDQSEISQLSHVTQPRVTQLMNLNHLAPDIQEQLLFLPRVTAGRDPIHEKTLRPIVAVSDWAKQRRMWAQLCPARTPQGPANATS